MLAMENNSRNSKLSYSLKQRRSGYEPSDTENEWQDSPWHELMPDVADRPKTPARYFSPLSRNKRYSSSNHHDFNVESPTRMSRTKTSPIPRKSNRSPYKPSCRDDPTANDVLSTRNISPYSRSERALPRDDTVNGVVSPHRNTSPYLRSDRRKHVSPYKSRRDEQGRNDNEILSSSSRKQSRRTPPKRVIVIEEDGVNLPYLESSRVSQRSNYSHRSMSAPKPRKEASVHLNGPSASEINEMAGEAKLSQGLVTDSSVSHGDIFFSKEYSNLSTQKNPLSKNNGFGSSFPPRPKLVSERDTTIYERRPNANCNQNIHVVPSNNLMSRTNTSSSSASSRRSLSKSSMESSKMNDGGRPSSDSFRKFTTNVQKIQKEKWFGCVRKGSCRTSSKSPEATREVDEASYIEKAVVVENLKQFWADKHQPTSLTGFTCHKQEAHFLKQLISQNSCPHILFKGPPGSGKKALTMALLCDLFGDSACNISHDLRYFQIQENNPMQVVVPIASSPHHVELNLKSESQTARYAIMGLVKDITSHHAIIPEVSIIDATADFKVIVLYDVDKAEENVQHLIKWIMDCHTDACKIILCCEDDADILDSVKSHCKVVNVDAPAILELVHEVEYSIINGIDARLRSTGRLGAFSFRSCQIMNILIQIAKKENFDLPMNFAAKIATKSKQNLRKAIVALEACKSHNYPFVDEQPISLGWEDVLVDLAATILADPSPKRLFFTRGKFQKLLVDFVDPKLILQKLVEQFLKRVEASSRRELYYWHAYYEKRLPMGTSALLKLEGNTHSSRIVEQVSDQQVISPYKLVIYLGTLRNTLTET